MAEFYAALRKLRKRETQQWGFATYAKPGDSNNLFSEIMPIIAGFGGAFFEKGAPTATKPETVEALKFYKRIYDEDLIPRGLDINVYRQLFAEGKIAMYASGPFMSGLVRKASAADGRARGCGAAISGQQNLCALGILRNWKDGRA
ncbi:MAG: extracellular solute-binding protein [Mesorhizobium sp.]|nr:MAG: extracellular solute-binding protein [Mesorhizobium sp.]